MKNNQKHIRFSKKSVLILVFGIAILLGGWLAFTNFAPRPLGDKLEYLGKDSYGCWHGYCDARLTNVYWYATDMRPLELAAYFKKASIDETERDRIKSMNNDSIPRSFFYLVAPDGDHFYIEYISKDQKTPEERGLKHPTKKFVINLSEEGYEVAKKAL